MTSRAGGGLDDVPPPVLFVVGAVSQYLGAALAITLFDRMAPAGVAWLRVVTFATVLTILTRPPWRSWDRSDRRAAAAFGVALAAMNLCFYLAADRLPLGTAVAIEFLGPITVAAAAARTGRNLAALGLAAGGVLILAEVEARGDLLGIAFALAAAAWWAGYIVLGKRVASRRLGVDGLAAAGVVGALAIMPFGLPAAVSSLDEPAVLGLAALVGLCSSLIPYALDQVVLRRLSQGQFALLLALLPATAAVVGAVVLQQSPSAAEVAGIGLVVAAVAIRAR